MECEDYRQLWAT